MSGLALGLIWWWGFRKVSLRWLNHSWPARHGDAHQHRGKFDEAISEIESILAAARVKGQGDEGDDAGEQYD